MNLTLITAPLGVSRRKGSASGRRLPAALAHFRKRSELGFSDCMLLDIAREAGHLPLGTFDRELGKLPDVEKR